MAESTEPTPTPERKPSRLRRANRRLRDQLARYRRLFYVAAVLVVGLAVTLGFVAADAATEVDDGPDSILLGKGRAGVMTADSLRADSLRRDSLRALADAEAQAEPSTSMEAPETPPPSAAAAPQGQALGSGEASYYSDALAGRPTASGAPYDPGRLTAAHRTLPLGSRVRVTNSNSGRSVVVEITDRGPFHGNRVIDLSRAAARQVGLLQSGVGRVRLELIR